MIAGIADTHTVLWYLVNDARLSAAARAFIKVAAEAGDNIGVSAITLVEIVYLVEKGKIAANQFTQLAQALETTDNVLRLSP